MAAYSPPMRIGSLDFSPGLWPTLITVLLLGLLLSLGFWQLDRANQKREILSEYEAGPDSTVFQLEATSGAVDTERYQFAVATGVYDNAHQFLLDNRTRSGYVGYEVLTPFVIRGSGVAVLVNRGWVPLTGDRSAVPDIGVGEEIRTVTGRIKQPSRSFMLGEDDARVGWPYRIQAIDTARLSKEVGYSLLPLVLLLDSREVDGFDRDWRLFSFGPERNVGYAVQWFGLAMALLIIYLVVNTRKLGKRGL